jgi:NADH:ubiquinone oxidoreductase subunit D
MTRAGRALSGAFLGLLHNRALKTRLGGVGQLTLGKLRNYGITGVIGRSGGLALDLRLSEKFSYGVYRSLTFRTFLGRRGDNLDRFLLRIKEVIETLRILSQVIGHANASTRQLGKREPRDVQGGLCPLEAAY